MKITEGCRFLAITNKVFTSFSDSPIHLDVRVDGDMLKKVEFVSEAMLFPIKVLPVPGGPNNRIPLGGCRRPVKISGRFMGHNTISCE